QPARGLLLNRNSTNGRTRRTMATSRRKRKRQKMRREDGCEVCGVPVKYYSREKFLEAGREGSRVRCEQCRSYVFTGTARESQLPSEQEFPALGLRRKVGRGAKHKRGLESLKLSRCGLPNKE